MAVQHRRDPSLFKAATTYNAAASHFDAEPLAFWDRHGQRIVQLLDLRPGARILDVGCGTGASALPAAAAVGDLGHVTGIDVAEEMLNHARAKATVQGRRNIAFENRDMRNSALPDAHYDVVISVFSIFFVDDMRRLLEELWQKVRPGGKLAVTTWGPHAFQPCAEIFAGAMSLVRSSGDDMPRPWERLSSQKKLRQLFDGVSASSLEIVTVSDQQPLRRPEDWWTIVLGSGYRSDIDQLGDCDRARVRDHMLKGIRAAGVDAIETNAIHAIARKHNDT